MKTYSLRSSDSGDFSTSFHILHDKICWQYWLLRKWYFFLHYTPCLWESHTSELSIHHHTIYNLHKLDFHQQNENNIITALTKVDNLHTHHLLSLHHKYNKNSTQSFCFLLSSNIQCFACYISQSLSLSQIPHASQWAPEKECSGLTLARCQVLTKTLYHSLFLTDWRKKNTTKGWWIKIMKGRSLLS